jgi:predicted enzyme related to lactoylglutathione lyase
MEQNCVELFVIDMEIMVNFYHDVLGLETNWNGETKAELSRGIIRMIMYDVKRHEIKISKTYIYPVGTLKIEFNLDADAVDRTYKELIDLGAKSVLPPETNESGQRTCCLADPEGNKLKFKSI